MSNIINSHLANAENDTNIRSCPSAIDKGSDSHYLHLGQFRVFMIFADRFQSIVSSVEIVLPRLNPFQIFRAIISFVAIDMVYLPIISTSSNFAGRVTVECQCDNYVSAERFSFSVYTHSKIAIPPLRLLKDFFFSRIPSNTSNRQPSKTFYASKIRYFIVSIVSGDWFPNLLANHSNTLKQVII